MRTLFIIPGFMHGTDHRWYRWFQKDPLPTCDVAHVVHIDWKYRVMTDYVAQFEDIFHQKRGEHNSILGFSFGAMIALLSAHNTQPDHLLLCSLSPYFMEDLPHLKPWWKLAVGVRRLRDFTQYSAREAARQIQTPTHIFYGEKEAKQFPSLKRRCASTARDLAHAQLTIVPEAGHNIHHKNYQETIRQTFHDMDVNDRGM